MKKRFRGGVALAPNKRDTRTKTLELIDPPETLCVPLALRSGVECSAEVAPGDRVKVGSLLGVGEARVHSPVSGTVLAVEPRPCPFGGEVPTVELANDFTDSPDPFAQPRGGAENLTKDDIFELAHGAGLVLADSAEPLYARLRAAVEPIDTLIINCAAPEPYLTARRRAMMDTTDELMSGARLLARAVDAKRTVLAVCSEDHDAAARIEARLAASDVLSVRLLPTRYPIASEKSLVRAVAGVEPRRGARCESVGVLVIEAEAAVALSRAATSGAPMLTRTVTVAGDAVANPKNLLVRIGTPLEELIDAAGGLKREPQKLILGGPISGISLDGSDYCVTADTSALLAFSAGALSDARGGACIRCGRCIAACPERLDPSDIARLFDRGSAAELRSTGADACVECGCCAYVCPAKLPLVNMLRAAKLKIAVAAAAETQAAGDAPASASADADAADAPATMSGKGSAAGGASASAPPPETREPSGDEDREGAAAASADTEPGGGADGASPDAAVSPAPTPSEKAADPKKKRKIFRKNASEESAEEVSDDAE